MTRAAGLGARSAARGGPEANVRLVEHLYELRNRLAVALLANLATAIVG